MSQFKPMLAKGKIPIEKLKLPVVVQPKLDGIRVSIVNGQPVSRTLKPIRNREIFKALSAAPLEGFDGEIVVGPPTAEDAFHRTSSFVMAREPDPEPWTYWVFDKWDASGGIIRRLDAAHNQLFANQYIDDPTESAPPLGGLQFVPTDIATVQEGVEYLERHYITLGYEGLITRNPDAPYKYGRGTGTVQELVKIKRFEDAEAQIIGVVEEQHNANEAKENALGRTERSTAKAGLVGKGTLGALVVRDLETGVEFQIGTGFTSDQRSSYWTIRALLYNRIVKYKSFKIGEKDKPRFPVFLGFRDVEDM